MFLSSNVDYPGYEAYCLYTSKKKKIQVFLDGKEVTSHCVFADDLNKYVILNKVDENGNLFVDKKKGEVASEIRYGTIVIQIQDEYRTLPP